MKITRRSMLGICGLTVIPNWLPTIPVDFSEESKYQGFAVTNNHDIMFTPIRKAYLEICEICEACDTCDICYAVQKMIFAFEPIKIKNDCAIEKIGMCCNNDCIISGNKPLGGPVPIREGDSFRFSQIIKVPSWQGDFFKVPSWQSDLSIPTNDSQEDRSFKNIENINSIFLTTEMYEEFLRICKHE